MRGPQGLTRRPATAVPVPTVAHLEESTATDCPSRSTGPGLSKAASGPSSPGGTMRGACYCKNTGEAARGLILGDPNLHSQEPV